jgi:hypothetical protein
MASEDSDQFVSGLAMVHRLCQLGYLDETLTGQMPAGVDDVHAPRELLEIVPLRRPQGMLTEERDDRVDQFRASTHVVLAQGFLMVVMALVEEDPAYPEEPLELFKAGSASFALRHDEPMEDLVAGSVAFSTRAIVLAHEPD